MDNEMCNNVVYLCSDCVFCEGDSCAWEHNYFNFDEDFVDCEDFELQDWDLIFQTLTERGVLGQGDEDDGNID